MRIYVTSDTHFNHKNIIKYCNRPFRSVEGMNRHLIDMWNNTVKPDDIIIHLGDVIFGMQKEKEDFFKNINKILNGKIYFIKGNHDHHLNKLKKIIKIRRSLEIEKYKIIFTHAPIIEELLKPGYLNIHGHTHDKLIHPKEKYYNACVEVHDFKPVLLTDILKERKHYGKEE